MSSIAKFLRSIVGGGKTADPPKSNEKATDAFTKEKKKEDKTEEDWVYDFISSFLRSPPWTVPLNSFIDQHCIFFDGDEENKFVHTDLHKEFIQVVETTLSANLRDLGITDEEFASAIELSATKNDQVNLLVFGQILACENFTVFKKLMVKRNRELEAEAMAELQRISGSKDSGEMEEEAQLIMAMKLSTATNVSELHRRRADIEAEQADLEHAIALSLQFEADRLRRLEAATKEERAAELEETKAVTPAQKEEASKKVKKAKRKKKQIEEALVMERDEIISPTSQASQAPDASHSSWSPSSAGSPQLLFSASQSSKQSSKLDSPQSQGGQGGGRGASPQGAQSQGGASFPSKGGAERMLPQLKGVLTKGSRLGTLPSPSDLSRELDAKKEMAREDFASTRTVQQATNQAMEALLRTQSKVSSEELKRRQEFLRQQRDLLLKKKLRENESELAQYQQDVRQGEQQASAGPQASAIDAKREAMRFALAKRFKEDMAAAERNRRSEAENKYDSLQDSLYKAQRLRSELEHLDSVGLEGQEELKRKRLDKMHKAMTTGVRGHEDD